MEFLYRVFSAVLSNWDILGISLNYISGFSSTYVLYKFSQIERIAGDLFINLKDSKLEIGTSTTYGKVLKLFPFKLTYVYIMERSFSALTYSSIHLGS